MSKSAIVLGASGETGKEVLKHLQTCPDFVKVILVGRRNLELESSNKVEQRVIDFDKIDEHAPAFGGADVAFCCLGTTRGKAGKEGFIKVDQDYVMNSAKKLLEAGCPDFHLVSSKGANASSFLLYSQIKGKVDNDLQELGFQRVSIYRPGLLMCDRQEPRFMEKMARCVSSAFDRSNAYSIPTDTLAKIMVANSLKPLVDGKKSEVLEHSEILKAAAQ